MVSKGLRNVSNVSFPAQSLVSYKFLSLYPETRVVLTLIKKMSLQLRLLMKIITNQYAELGNPVLTDLYLRLSQGSLQSGEGKLVKCKGTGNFL